MKSASSWALGIFAVASTAVVTATLVSTRARSAAVAPASTADPIVSPSGEGGNERLAGQMAALQAQVNELKGRADTPAPGAGAAPKPAAPDEPPLPVAEQRAREEEFRRKVMDGVEADFRKEVPDAKFAATAGAALEAALRADEVHLTARNVECRATSCRVELGDDGSMATQESLERLAPLLGPTLPTMQISRLDDEGGRRMVVYFSRPAETAQR
jgi:hypothetical protein